MSNPYGDMQTHLGSDVLPLVSPLPVVIRPETLPLIGPDLLRWVPVDQVSSGELELAVAETGKRHQMLGWVLTFANIDGEEDHTLQFFSNTTPLTGKIIVPPNTGLVPLIIPPQSIIPIFQTEVGEALNLKTENATLRGVVIFITETAANP